DQSVVRIHARTTKGSVIFEMINPGHPALPADHPIVEHSCGDQPNLWVLPCRELQKDQDSRGSCKEPWTTYDGLYRRNALAAVHQIVMPIPRTPRRPAMPPASSKAL